MNPTLNNERELYFERGGPSYRLMQRIGLVRGDDPSVRRRIIGFLALTWIPLLMFCPILARTRREWLRSYSLLVVPIEKVLDTLGGALL